jgi:hypothetical protein
MFVRHEYIWIMRALCFDNERLVHTMLKDVKGRFTHETKGPRPLHSKNILLVEKANSFYVHFTLEEDMYHFGVHS